MNYTKLINGYSFKLVLLIISSEKKNKTDACIEKKGWGVLEWINEHKRYFQRFVRKNAAFFTYNFQLQQLQCDYSLTPIVIDILSNTIFNFFEWRIQPALKGSVLVFTVIRRTRSGARLHEILRGSVFSDSIWLQLQPNLTIYTISKRNWESK